MGTWGTGNFDSDGALDNLAELVDQLVQQIQDLLGSEDGEGDVDEDGESKLMPWVHIVGLLSTQCKAAPPKPDVVEAWRDKYVKRWDAQIDGLDPEPSFKVGRRAVIIETFDGLLKHSKEFWIRTKG